MSKAMSLKAKIRNIARQKNIPAQVILQNYMFERFLVRLSASKYKEKFVLKGGMLVAAIVGLDNRATMDMDTTLKNLPLDAITPHAVQYSFSEIFDNEKTYELWAYNIETVMAEKVETILRRGVFNTRPRDFYDAYILTTTQKFDKSVFDNALQATAKHRGTTQQISDVSGILHNIEESVELQNMWNKYRKQFAYASDVEYSQIMAVLRSLM